MLGQHAQAEQRLKLAEAAPSLGEFSTLVATTPKPRVLEGSSLLTCCQYIIICIIIIMLIVIIIY